MEFYKKILITIILIISSYIIIRLLWKRDEIIRLTKKHQHIEQDEDYINEEFTGLNVFSSVAGELSSVSNKGQVSISNSNESYLLQPLKQFCIKGSYNSAVTGNYVNLDMIKYVLSRGCRYLDFEVFMIDSSLNVSYTTDPKNNSLDTDNTLSLRENFKLN